MTANIKAKTVLSVLLFTHLLALPLAAFSDTEMRARTFVQTIGTDSLGNEEENSEYLNLKSPDNGGNVIELLTNSQSLSGASFSAGGPVSATALATQGYLIVDIAIGSPGSQAFVGVLTDNFYGSHEASATARFEDDVIIDAPGLTGTQGTATFHYTHDTYLILDGFIQPDDLPSTQNYPQLSVSMRYSVKVGSYRKSFDSSRSLSPAGDITLDGMPEEVVAESFDFTYGSPFEIRVAIDAGASFDANNFQLAQGRVSGGTPTGFQWLGMTGLPENATVTGIIDWSKSAPSPFTGEDPDPGPIVGPPSGSGATGGGGSGGSINGWLAGVALILIELRRRSKSKPSLPLGLSP